MKRRKIDHNYWTNYKLKRAIAVLLTTISPIIASGCNANNKTIEESTTSYHYVDENNDLKEEKQEKIEDIIQIDNSFENTDNNKKENNENGIIENNENGTIENNDIIIENENINLNELNNLISEIKSLNYLSQNKEFIDYDIYSKPQKELDIIKKSDTFDKYKPSNYDINYNWYSNGKVDSDLLYKRIIENNRKAGIKITDKCDSIARMVADVLQNNIDLLKEKNPNFSFNIPFYNINTLTVNTSTEEWYYSLYVYDYNRILVNFTDINSNDFFRSTVSHELFHLMFNGTTKLEDVYMQSTGIDTLSTEERPLEQNFMNEYFVDKFSYEAFGDEMNIYSYHEEKRHIDLLCLSTGKDINYFESCVVNFDRNGLINCFEEEFRNVNFAFSTYCAFDKSCFYGDFPDEYDKFMFKESCFEYGAFNSLKNAYVRLLKEYAKGNITKEEIDKHIKKMIKTIEGISYISDELQESIDELNTVYNSYINSKVK